MSTGTSIPLAEARAAAVEIADLLRPATQRLEIAGSIRRQEPVVHDIEIVVEPALFWRYDLWGRPDGPFDLLAPHIDGLIADGVIQLRNVAKDGRPLYRNGARYKALWYRGTPVDLFIVRPPATWGVTLFLRTGPADWNQRVVTDCQRCFRAFRDGQVLVMGRPVPTDEEREVFEALGLEWVEPPERSEARVRWETIP